MKMILKFDTEKDEDFNAYKTYIKAEDMSVALYNITNLLRQRLKYESNNFSEQTYNEIEKLRDEIWDIINDYDLKNIID